LLAKAHHELLCLIGDRAGRHFQGLARAATVLRLPENRQLRPNIRALESATAVARHITGQNAWDFSAEVAQALRLYTLGAATAGAPARANSRQQQRRPSQR